MDMSKFKDLLEKLEQEEKEKEKEQNKENSQMQTESKKVEQSTPSQSPIIDQGHTIRNNSSGYRSDSYNYVEFIYNLRKAYKALPQVHNLHMPEVSVRINNILHAEGYVIIRPKVKADRTIYQLPNLDTYVECDDGYRYFADDNTDDSDATYQPEIAGDDSTQIPIPDGNESYRQQMEQIGKMSSIRRMAFNKFNEQGE